MIGCTMCGGPTAVLGPMGDIVHLRCVSCGWQDEATMEEGSTLWDYRTGGYLRPATPSEWAKSLCAGDTGVIEVVIDGETVSAYVN